MLSTQQPVGVVPTIFNGCKELLTLDKIKGRKPPPIRYEFEIESETVYPRLPDPTAEDQPLIKPTVKEPIIFSDTGTTTQDIQALDSYNDCDSFHDCAGVLE